MSSVAAVPLARRRWFGARSAPLSQPSQSAPTRLSSQLHLSFPAGGSFLAGPLLGSHTAQRTPHIAAGRIRCTGTAHRAPPAGRSTPYTSWMVVLWAKRFFPCFNCGAGSSVSSHSGTRSPCVGSLHAQLPPQPCTPFPRARQQQPRICVRIRSHQQPQVQLVNCMSFA